MHVGLDTVQMPPSGSTSLLRPCVTTRANSSATLICSASSDGYAGDHIAPPPLPVAAGTPSHVLTSAELVHCHEALHEAHHVLGSIHGLEVPRGAHCVASRWSLLVVGTKPDGTADFPMLRPPTGL